VQTKGTHSWVRIKVQKGIVFGLLVRHDCNTRAAGQTCSDSSPIVSFAIAALAHNNRHRHVWLTNRARTGNRLINGLRGTHASRIALSANELAAVNDPMRDESVFADRATTASLLDSALTCCFIRRYYIRIRTPARPHGELPERVSQRSR
jgi:hypothetical protein